MALQMELEMDTGIILPEAYVRITEGVLSLDRGITFITVQTYADKDARDSGKKSVKVHEVKATIEDSSPKKNATYELRLIDVEADNTNKLLVDLNGDGTSEFDFTEWIDFSVDGDLDTLTDEVVRVLSDNTEISYSFEVNKTGLGLVEIKAKDLKGYDGSLGNNLNVSGSIVSDFTLKQEGKDRLPSTFEKFFNVETMNKDGVNVISQAYEFIKTLPEYQNSIDVL